MVPCLPSIYMVFGSTHNPSPAMKTNQTKQKSFICFVPGLCHWMQVAVSASLPWMEMLVAGLGGSVPGHPLLVMGRELGSAPLLLFSSGKTGRIVVEGIAV